MITTEIVNEFKRGGTFEIEVELYDKFDNPLVIRVEDMQAQLKRFNDAILAQLTIAETIEPGVYALSTDANTSDWALEQVYTDIYCTIEGKKRPSDTLYITIVKQVTRPPVVPEPEPEVIP